MVFKTFNSDIDNSISKIGMFNKSFWAMQQDLEHGNGLAFSIFGGQRVKNTDKQAILDLNTQLQNGEKPGKAWAKTMTNCSIAAQEQTRQCLRTKGSLKELANGLNTTSVASKAAEVGMKALSTAGNMLLGMAISFGISKLIEGLDYLINYEEKQKEVFENAKTATEEAAKSIRDIKSEMSNTSSKAKDLSSEFANLVQGVNPFTNENKSLSTEQYEKFLDVNNQLAELFPSLTHNYDENGNAILGLSGDVDTVTASIAKLVEQQNNLAKADLRDKLDEYVNGTDDNEGAFTVLKGSKKEADDAKKNLNKLKSTYNSLVKRKGSVSLFNEGEYNDYLDYIKNKFGDEAYNLVEGATQKRAQEKGSGIYDIDFSKLALDEKTKGKITESYNTFYQDLQTNLSVKQSELESKNQEMSNQMMVWVEDLDLYKNSDNESFKRAIESMVGSIQWSDLDVEEGNIEEAKQLIQSLVITPLSSACSDPDQKLQVTNAINSLFSIDFSKLSYKEASEKIKGFITILRNAINNGLPKEQKKSEADMYDMFGLTEYKDSADKMKSSLSSIAKKGSSDYQRLENYTSKFTQKQSEAWITATEGAKSADEAIQNYENSLKSKSEIKPQDFKSVWDSIGTTGDKDAKKVEKEEKKRLKELAEAGKLTEEELSKSSLAKKFEDAGVSIAKATKEINKFKSSADQLASMKTGISSISSILGEKKEKQSSKKTRNEGIGADTLAGMPDDLKDQKKEYEHFVEVLGDGSSSMEDCRKAANKLATAYVNSNNFLSKLTDGTKDYYTSVLTEMGVENAAQVVQQSLNTKKVDEMLLNWDIVNATEEEIAAKAAEVGALEGANQALKDYAFQKALASKGALDTSSSVANLITLAKQCGITGESIKELQKLQNLIDESSRISKDTSLSTNEKNIRLAGLSGQIAAQQGKLNSIAKKKVKVGSTAGLGIKPKRSGSSKTKGDKSSKSSKNTKQEMNWLERRLTRMQNIIDLTASKLQNLFSVKAKNNNLDKQIKQTTKLMKQYGVAAKRYQTKADSVAKGSTKKIKSGKNKGKKKKVKPLSKSIIKKIQSGELTKAKAKKLFKNYNQSYYDRISSYIDYYDKAQDAKKNQYDTRAKIRELEIDKQKNIQDDADKKIEKYQTQRENALLKDKNNTIKAQIDATKQSYDAQIRIAQIERDTETEAKLRADKIKAINDLYQEEIDNIKANADAKIKLLETGIIDKNGNRKSYGQQYYRDQVSLTEARGAIVDKQWYRIQSDIEDDKIKEAQTERNQLIAKLGNFDEGTQGWYNLQSDISDCEHTINEAKIAQIENTKAMRSITEAMEEKYDQWYSNFNSELSFLSSLQSGDHADSDTGTFTDSGNLGIYTQALTFKSANAEKDYWRDQTTALQGLIDKKASIEKIKDAGFEFESIEDAEKALDDYYQKWQDAISTEKSAEEAIVDLMKEKYEAQKDYLQDIIDAKKEALDIEKDLYDYQQNIADKTKNVATLQKQINALRGDTSEEGRARLAKLQVSLDESQQDLKNAEFERYVSEQQNMLDNMMKQYDDLLTRLLKETDKILADGLKYVADNIKDLSPLLTTTAGTYDYIMSSGLSTVNSSLATGATTIGTKIDTSGKTTEEIRNAIKGIKGDDPSSVVGLLQSLPGKIIKEYRDSDSGTSGNGDKTGNGSNGGSTGNPSGTTGGTTQQTQTKNGQTTVTPDAMDKIEGTNEKLKNLRNALNSMKGAGFEKYWTLKSGTPKSYINQRIAAEPNYDKVYPNGKRKAQILTEKGLKLLAKKLGVKYPSSGSAKTADLNKYVKDAGFRTGGIAHIVKSNGEDGLMMARNGEGFVAPEHVESIQKLLSITPDIGKFTEELLKTPKIQPQNQTTSNSIGEVNFHMDINPENFPDFVDQLQNSQRVRQIFSVAVNDLVKNGKITSNIQRY